jgi:S1-C subfamily serine protease
MIFDAGVNPQAILRAQDAIDKIKDFFFGKANVVGMGVGVVQRPTMSEPSACVVVNVEKKKPLNELNPGDVVPRTIGNVPTDVVEVGRMRALELINPRLSDRPASPGVSIGHPDVTAGTFGCLVRRDGQLYILSNNHVLADVNRAQIGDPILQPGPADGGNEDYQIATLADSIPLRFMQEESECPYVEGIVKILNFFAKRLGSMQRVEARRLTYAENLVDAALAKPLTPDFVEPGIIGLGVPVGVGEVDLGTEVQKYGRTSGLTEGRIVQIDVTMDVQYDGRPVRFSHQIMASAFSKPGDSGSAVLDMDKNIVGLLFAGSDNFTLVNPINLVMDALKVEPVLEQE